ncbi:hypothetical protein ZWY2020_009095, partial [Hordeum vulgare]
LDHNPLLLRLTAEKEKARYESRRYEVFWERDAELPDLVQKAWSAFGRTQIILFHGRCRWRVFNFVKLEELYYAGSHGMDIKGPTKLSDHNAKADEVLCQRATDFLPVIQETLTAKMKSIQGAMVENNKFCLSVHLRCMKEREWDALGRKKVLEIRPSINWYKGNALEFLLVSIGYAGRGDVFPIYIGDDRTDEDAFKVLRNMGQGIGILVTKFPKETSASYSLREPAEVKEFLWLFRKSAHLCITKHVRLLN